MKDWQWSTVVYYIFNLKKLLWNILVIIFTVHCRKKASFQLLSNEEQSKIKRHFPNHFLTSIFYVLISVIKTIEPNSYFDLWPKHICTFAQKLEKLEFSLFWQFRLILAVKLTNWQSDRRSVNICIDLHLCFCLMQYIFICIWIYLDVHIESIYTNMHI